MPEIAVVKQFLDLSPHSRPVLSLQRVKGVVLHYTGNPMTTAQQNWKYFNSKKDNFASAHFIVDFDGSIIQCLPINEKAFHCGADTYKPGICAALGLHPNNTTVGIEMCCKDSAGSFTPQTQKAAELLTAALCRRLALNPRISVYRHYDITGKDCPRWFVTHTDRWIEFLQNVNAIYENATETGVLCAKID